jgi:hypothetical protein|tara:strand:- start:1903 stop:2094 length:192 start_codon:yes stop_codon:yes gene_type:complete
LGERSPIRSAVERRRRRRRRRKRSPRHVFDCSGWMWMMFLWEKGKKKRKTYNSSFFLKTDFGT